MPNLYCQVHRLKAQGWTWDQFLDQVASMSPGVDEKTLKALHRLPHRKANKHVASIIERLHQHCFPSPFPDEVEALMRIYNRTRAHQAQEQHDHDGDDFLLFLGREIDMTNELLRNARLHWLMANIYFDRITELRESSRQETLLTAQTHAIEHYEQALELIEAHKAEKLIPNVAFFESFKLRQNILACLLNAESPETRYRSQKVLDHVVASGFLAASEAVLKEEPYQWVVARNGLRFSSLVQDAEQSLLFFGLLVAANKLFADIHYNPQFYPAIADSPEFGWAIQNVIGVG